MVDLLGKTVRVTDSGFMGELEDKLNGSLRKVEKVYWESPGGTAGLGITCPESIQVPWTDDDGDEGFWCVIYPNNCELVEEDSK